MSKVYLHHLNPSPRSGLQKDVSNGPAILVSHTGEEVDVHAIKPTKAQAIFDRMDIDGVIHENEDPISSGSLSFREVIKIQIYTQEIDCFTCVVTQVRMENMAKGCGRSDNIEGVERRPRIVIPTVESKVDSLTSTTYTSTVYSTTYTFAVAVSTIDSINRYKFFTINAFISTFSQILIHNNN